mmetsp:Transcript_2561/g.7094  ORF Transcript_2561/g.7094 Transcript_2561/m.7094 type:complete len:222 (+) Transcript_2561:500-1165(+)
MGMPHSASSRSIKPTCRHTYPERIRRLPREPSNASSSGSNSGPSQTGCHWYLSKSSVRPFQVKAHSLRGSSESCRPHPPSARGVHRQRTTLRRFWRRAVRKASRVNSSSHRQGAPIRTRALSVLTWPRYAARLRAVRALGGMRALRKENNPPIGGDTIAMMVSIVKGLLACRTSCLHRRPDKEARAGERASRTRGRMPWSPNRMQCSHASRWGKAACRSYC